MAFDDLGSALTEKLPQALDLSPTARSALLAFGLQAMQPTAIGQTPLGHIAQAIGSAGETVTRQEVMDQKAELQESKLATAEERLQIAREGQAQRERGLDIRERTAAGQLDSRERALDIRERLGQTANEIRERNAATREAGLDMRERHFERRQQDKNSRKIGGLTDQFRARSEQQNQNAYERTISEDAKLAFKANEGFVLDKNHAYAKYKGMTVDQIREQMRKDKPYVSKLNYGGPSSTPSTADDEDDDEAVPTPQTETPPVAGARKAPDGQWYVPNEDAPGKWKRVILR